MDGITFVILSVCQAPFCFQTGQNLSGLPGKL